MELALFALFAVFTLGSAVMVILSRSAITSAMSLVSTFFFLAGLYVLLLAHTIAVLQVLVYAGAIMVLFLFVIMLLSLTDKEPGDPFSLGRLVGGLSAVAVLAFLGMAIFRYQASSGAAMPAPEFGTLKLLGQALYTQYLLPFEAVSLLLLAAIVGAVVVAKPRI
jgi:NADH-quinone oxidoreductase subunit J